MENKLTGCSILLSAALFSTFAHAQSSGNLYANPNPAAIAPGQTTADVSVTWTTFNPGGNACVLYYRVSPPGNPGPGVCGNSGTHIYSLDAGVYSFSLMRASDFSILNQISVTVTSP